MRELILAVLLIGAAIFMLPFIMGLTSIIVILACLFFFLARLGLFNKRGKEAFRVYTYSTKGAQNKRSRRRVIFDEDSVRKDSGETAGWYESTQEGEMITLPETALKKENK